ncbi:hypothetical protein BDN71DRAFT_1508290 [Pleurotus eryngii]|uniref:Uncharacterized protein n=1 Tax=Pleurotus eryngii TaxID=5323 RepID=A0A9P5ZW63_PLEER|nr:hypothetical protein BDN71DRAFT_1508290 [Pleurotus eryngii]
MPRVNIPHSHFRTTTPYSHTPTPHSRASTRSNFHAYSRAPTPYSRASTPDDLRARTPTPHDPTPDVHPRPHAPTPHSRARNFYPVIHEAPGSEELLHLTQQLGQARVASDAMIDQLVQQVNSTRAVLQTATVDANRREVAYQMEIEDLKDKISCLDGSDVQRFEEMTATIADLEESHANLQTTYNILLKMHTGICVDSQRLSSAHEDLKHKFDAVTTDHEQLQRTCEVLENLRDHLAEDTNSKAAAFDALTDFVRCKVCDTLMAEPQIICNKLKVPGTDEPGYPVDRRTWLNHNRRQMRQGALAQARSAIQARDLSLASLSLNDSVETAPQPAVTSARQQAMERKLTIIGDIQDQISRAHHELDVLDQRNTQPSTKEVTVLLESLKILRARGVQFEADLRLAKKRTRQFVAVQTC